MASPEVRVQESDKHKRGENVGGAFQIIVRIITLLVAAVGARGGVVTSLVSFACSCHGGLLFSLSRSIIRPVVTSGFKKHPRCTKAVTAGAAVAVNRPDGTKWEHTHTTF